MAMSESERAQFQELIEAVRELSNPTQPPEPQECPLPRRQRPGEKDRDYVAFINMWLDIFEPDE
jgi:hypothetical protein